MTHNSEEKRGRQEFLQGLEHVLQGIIDLFSGEEAEEETGQECLVPQQISIHWFPSRAGLGQCQVLNSSLPPWVTGPEPSLAAIPRGLKGQEAQVTRQSSGSNPASCDGRYSCSYCFPCPISKIGFYTPPTFMYACTHTVQTHTHT